VLHCRKEGEVSPAGSWIVPPHLRSLHSETPGFLLYVNTSNICLCSADFKETFRWEEERKVLQAESGSHVHK